MQSYSGVIVQKNGDIKETTIKADEIKNDLYKKCNFRKSDGFEKQCEWKIKLNKVVNIVKLYARRSGKSGTENKYDFPPPVDTTLFFGNILLVNYTVSGEPANLTADQWETFYEKLFGGFENLDDTKEEDENELDELAEVPKELKTKTGYLKDGFVVDETEKLTNTSNEDGSDNPTEEEYDDQDECDEDEDDDVEPSLNSSSELEEEEYDYTDEI